MEEKNGESRDNRVEKSNLIRKQLRQLKFRPLQLIAIHCGMTCGDRWGEAST